MAVDIFNKELNGKAKVRRWILRAIKDVKGGAIVYQIQKLLVTKQARLLHKPELKLNLKKLLDSGHLMKKGGKFVMKKRKTSGKDAKKSVAKKAKSFIKDLIKQKISVKEIKRIFQ
ncbi:hypothetical protein AVEN_61892-1 [Araneus ventricosus]|uniref:H15 domain-containing protein n=1 Tax=Araneus ventricosus TaxID=182803 RepID=A0A4Y2M8W7_ARAVE|nr:hypothetical protein AVEN_61892-1 [Araneus ventricosus]